MKLKQLQQKGDTIVEVMISLAVISVVLVGAYVSSNRNLTTNQASQERGEALKIAESQIERLKVNPPTGAGQLYICFNSSGTQTTSSAPPPLVSDNFSSYPAGCKQGTASRYNISISRPPASKTYTVYVRWDRIGGGLKQEIRMIYTTE